MQLSKKPMMLKSLKSMLSKFTARHL